ncbi:MULTISPECIES: ABC transporter permease [unclassified Rathayibacter]|uniref:ABC transporter permease n=1 Tax=unclassified Rathayibacter TaxID=2609250 RepID=UPI000CE835C7|nr:MULTISPECIES: ABC transporter permease [unclassified Rathayibacter]PPF12909.1 ABC transporter permease [Rathayibacter sp. AY1A5]PPF30057.1 ABC transporter permease [Rathayibacter sp. AY1F2]PPF30711.1 ABC transporter permease [Rathayibacter sp. AY1A3]PPF41159.1 ABC transporter permease [Rathayibacter sp. AY1A2]PPF55862.1 ABC transporter permease [Rathayibacter sp. AY1C2]
MNLIAEAFAWIADPAHWTGVYAIPTRVAQHVGISLLVLVIAAAIAIPIGYLIGHTGRGKGIAVPVAGGLRALPTLGVLVLAAMSLGLGLGAPVIALVVLAIPSVLAGAYSGLEAVDRRTVDAARSMGMTEWQILTKVEIPLGLPLLIGGLRSAALQIIATATLADYIGAGGLGQYIFRGVKSGDYPQMLAGSILVIVLTLLSEVLFALLQRLAVPRGVVLGLAGTAGRTGSRASSPRRRAVMGIPIEEGK